MTGRVGNDEQLVASLKECLGVANRDLEIARRTIKRMQKWIKITLKYPDKNLRAGLLYMWEIFKGNE